MDKNRHNYFIDNNGVDDDHPPKRIVRFSYLVHATGLSRGACYREMENNPDFPKKIKLGSRAIGFDADEIDAYGSCVIRNGTI